MTTGHYIRHKFHEFCRRTLALHQDVSPRHMSDELGGLFIAVFRCFHEIQTIVESIPQLFERIDKMANELATLKADVAANTTVVGGAITLLTTIKTQLDAALASGDTAALQALADTLHTDTQKLADAVLANTPGGPVVAPSGQPAAPPAPQPAPAPEPQPATTDPAASGTTVEPPPA